MNLFEGLWGQTPTKHVRDLKKRLGHQNRSARRRRVDINKRVEALEEELGRITLLCRALSDILVSRESVSLQELAELMNEIDLEDGVADGKVTKIPEKRPKKTRSRVKPRKRKR